MSYYNNYKYSGKRRGYYNRSQRSLDEQLSQFLALVIVSLFLAVISYIIKFFEYVASHPYLSAGVWLVILGITTAITIFFFKHKKKWKQKRAYAYSRYEELLKMNWREFEEYVEAMLQEQWYNTILGPWKNDGGVDIHAKKDHRNYIIQCKHYWDQQKVTVQQVREFYGVMHHEDSTAWCIYVTTWEFTNEATLFCKGEDIEIWDKKYFLNYLRENEVSKNDTQVEKDDTKTEKETTIEETTTSHWICEMCGGKLLVRTARNWPNTGQHFLWCENYPKCKFTKNI